MKIKKSLIKNTGKVIFRIVLVVLIIELGLRVSGISHEKYVELSNKGSLGDQDSVRILAGGDSMTYQGGDDSWPSQLEDILNSKDPEKRYEVFNTALPMSSEKAVTAILDNIPKIDPQIVVVMIGVSDEFEGATPEQGNEGRVDGSIIMGLRIVKLSREILGKIARDNQDHEEKVEEKDEGKENKLEDARYKYEQEFREKIESEPDNAERYLSFGIFEYLMRDYDKMVEILKEGEKIDKGNFEIQKYIGLAEYQRKNYNESEKHLDRAIAIKPDDDNLLYLLGKTYQRQGRESESLEMFVRAVTLNTTNIHPIFEIFLTSLEQGLEDQTKAVVEKIGQIRKEENIPADMDQIKSHSKMLMNKGMNLESEKYRKAAVSLDPYNISMYFPIISYYESFDRIEDARRIIKILLGMEMQDIGLLRTYGEYSLLLKDYKETINSLELYLMYDDTHTSLRTNLGIAYKKTDDLNRAAENFRQALVFDPDSLRAVSELAFIYYRLNQTGDAEKLLKEYQSKDAAFKKEMYRMVSNNLFEYGLNGLGKSIQERSIELNNGSINRKTRSSYERLIEQLATRHIRLIAVQYPGLPVDDLKDMIPSYDNVEIVGTLEEFKQALQVSSYDRLYSDRRFGDWGHATAYGNRIIAENVAEEILAAG